MKILLTGARGFLGTPCLERLVKRGHEVHAVTHAELPSDGIGVTWHKANLLAPGQAAMLVDETGAKGLLHLAWFTEHGRFWEASENLDWLIRSTELVRAMVEAGAERIVWAGTCAEYDWSADGPYDEYGSSLSPSSLYGACKHGLATVLEAYLAQSAISFAWGRVFFCFGPGEAHTRLVPSLIRSLHKGELVRVVNGDLRRDFLYVDDVADALVALFDSGVQGPVNIGSGRSVAIRTVATTIAETLGREDLLVFEAEPAGTDAPSDVVADIGRIYEEVGWIPTHDLASGINNSIEFWTNEIDA